MTISELSAQEAAALAAVDEAAIARTLLELIAIPSVTGSPAESELQHHLAGRLDRLGLDVDLWSMDLPALLAHPDFPGSEAPRDETWGLVGRTEDGGDGPTMILQGHVDVVPPGDMEQWEGDPFVPRVTGDTVRGRGLRRRPVAARAPGDGDLAGRPVRQRPPAGRASAPGHGEGGARGRERGRPGPRARRTVRQRSAPVRGGGHPHLQYGPGDIRHGTAPGSGSTWRRSWR